MPQDSFWIRKPRQEPLLSPGIWQRRRDIPRIRLHYPHFCLSQRFYLPLIPLRPCKAQGLRISLSVFTQSDTRAKSCFSGQTEILPPGESVGPFETIKDAHTPLLHRKPQLRNRAECKALQRKLLEKSWRHWKTTLPMTIDFDGKRQFIIVWVSCYWQKQTITLLEKPEQ